MVSIEKVGRRLYLVDLPFAAKNRAKSELGASWDADRKQWWVGLAKKAQAEVLAAELNTETAGRPLTEGEAKRAGVDPGTPAGIAADYLRDAGRDRDAALVEAGPRPAEDLRSCRVYARVTYRNRPWYVIAESAAQQRCRLATLDGSQTTWADMADCDLVRRYEGREKWDGRRYSGQTVTVYPTLGSIQDFVRRQQDPATRRVQCPECDAWHDEGEACRECGGC